ncbi:efflux transporter periplasmic adaptor subunit [Pseudoalteromonas phenolica]|uniref:Efflux transporter periplasmic adaptor subunit n=1 Tax=Pseudoalteromonas phenolica TaxID=161398 RepID=A0A5R9Q4P7_9GAMM|nr:efflux RND transporter periplasmic adaptor subunit [Pseudoalteromonas phenolica]TLX48141.1 efflux transporter periplasmic adaptor subunit [Pseudoalteromonas phenolica]
MSYIPDTSAQDSQVVTPKNKKKWIIRALVCLFIVISFYFVVSPLLMSWSGGQSAISIDKLRIAKVKKGDFIRDLAIQGKVIAARRPVLYSPAQGSVTYLVDAGDSVELSQVVARIESPELQSLFEQETTKLSRLKTQLSREKIQAKQIQLQQENRIGQAHVALNAAKREMRRSDEAIKNQVISDIDYQKAKDDLENAEREYNHVNKEVALLKESQAFEIQTYELEFNAQKVKVTELQRLVTGLEIRSPVVGVVGNLNFEQKNTVSKNQPLMSVVDLSEYELEVQIPEIYADDLAIGLLAEITFNENTFLGKLVAISPEISQGRVQGKVRFSKQSPANLRQNQRLTTRIILEQKQNVAYLPRGQYLQKSGQFLYVFRDGEAIRTPVKLGSIGLTKVEIVSGLAVNDQVVISNMNVFKEAQSVRVIQ